MGDGLLHAPRCGPTPNLITAITRVGMLTLCNAGAHVRLQTRGSQLHFRMATEQLRATASRLFRCGAIVARLDHVEDEIHLAVHLNAINGVIRLLAAMTLSAQARHYGEQLPSFPQFTNGRIAMCWTWKHFRGSGLSMTSTNRLDNPFRNG